MAPSPVPGQSLRSSRRVSGHSVSPIPDLRDLVALWRGQADAFWHYGADAQAAALEACANDLERILGERELFEVSEKMRERGDLMSVESSGPPGYRYGNLPRKTSRTGEDRLAEASARAAVERARKMSREVRSTESRDAG